MASIKANHYKVSEIYTNESSITDQKEINKYCKENGMNQFAPKKNKRKKGSNDQGIEKKAGRK